jgi:hypothetical protein
MLLALSHKTVCLLSIHYIGHGEFSGGGGGSFPVEHSVMFHIASPY